MYLVFKYKKIFSAQLCFYIGFFAEFITVKLKNYKFVEIFFLSKTGINRAKGSLKRRRCTYIRRTQINIFLLLSNENLFKTLIENVKH